MMIGFSISGIAPAAAQERVVPDTYLAVTTNMTPADVEIKADILRWSTETEREAVIEALQGDDPSAALGELPSLGAIWRSNSAVGNSIKYAHRTETADGGEIVTLVTDRRIGYSHFRPWEADIPGTDASLDYSVVTMTIGARNEGHGTLSLAAEVVVDPESNLVSLSQGDGASLLTNVRMAPKPYWAREH